MMDYAEKRVKCHAGASNARWNGKLPYSHLKLEDFEVGPRKHLCPAFN